MAWITKKPFTEWILVFAKLYFLPIDRIGRIDFLIAFTTVFLIAFLGVYQPGMQFELIKTGTEFTSFKLPPGKEYISQLVMINTIVCVWILLVAAVKRLKDLDSKIWYAIFVIVPFINLFVLLGLMLSEGSKGRNQYGAAKKPLSL